jgi:hypothetical protein
MNAMGSQQVMNVQKVRHVRMITEFLLAKIKLHQHLHVIQRVMLKNRTAFVKLINVNAKIKMLQSLKILAKIKLKMQIAVRTKHVRKAKVTS